MVQTGSMAHALPFDELHHFHFLSVIGKNKDESITVSNY